MLGGFQGRKSDGDPGWQITWYGWLRVQDMARGARLALEPDTFKKTIDTCV